MPIQSKRTHCWTAEVEQPHSSNESEAVPALQQAWTQPEQQANHRLLFLPTPSGLHFLPMLAEQPCLSPPSSQHPTLHLCGDSVVGPVLQSLDTAILLDLSLCLAETAKRRDLLPLPGFSGLEDSRRHLIVKDSTWEAHCLLGIHSISNSKKLFFP